MIACLRIEVNEEIRRPDKARWQDRSNIRRPFQIKLAVNWNGNAEGGGGGPIQAELGGV